MLETKIIAEVIALGALCCNIAGYRQHCMQSFRVYTCFAMALLSTHFFLIDALAASIGCGLAVIRNIVSLRYNNWTITAVFVILNLAPMYWQLVYRDDSWLIVLAYAASIIFTVATLRFNSTSITMRKVFLTAEILSIIYVVLVGSIVGTIYNSFNIIVLLHRLYIAPKSPIP